MLFVSAWLAAFSSSVHFLNLLLCSPSVDVPLGFAKLMKRCWDTKSNVRPKFVDIVNELNTIMNNLCLPVPKKEPGEVKTSFELENPLNCVSPWSKDRSKNNELVATDGTVFTYKGHK